MFLFGLFWQYVLCNAHLERKYRHPSRLEKKTGKTVYFRLAIDPLVWPWTHSSGRGLTRPARIVFHYSGSKVELSKKLWNSKGIVYAWKSDKDGFSCGLRGAMVSVVALKAKGRGFKWVQIYQWLFKHRAEALPCGPRLFSECTLNIYFPFTFCKHFVWSVADLKKTVIAW